MMKQRVITFGPDAPIKESARWMAGEKIGCVPVISKGHLVGLETTTNSLRYLESNSSSRNRQTPQAAAMFPALNRKTTRRFPPSSCAFAALLVLFHLAGWVAPAPAGQPTPRAQIVGSESLYTVQPGDSLTAISARMGVDIRVLTSDNGLPPGSGLRAGQKLRVDNRHIVPRSPADGIVINIPQRMLFYFSRGLLVQHFPVGLGRPDWRTPLGDFVITMKEENPTWDVPRSIQEEMRREGKPVLTCVPPGPDNPLGKHWLGLSIAGIGIHGTIAPASIYRFQTHGCIRAHPDDIAALYPLVAQGTKGTLLYQPLLIARIGDKVYLEAHRDIYRRESDLRQSLWRMIEDADLGSLVDRSLAEDIIRKQEGIARNISIGDPISDETKSRTPANK